jgi:hypothetical protein
MLDRRTVGLISALVRLTFQTAAPAALWYVDQKPCQPKSNAIPSAMLNLIFSQIYGSDKIISTAFNQALPKLYACSMMWTLNARRDIRLIHSGSTNPPSDRTRRTRGANELELGAMSGIQVRTHLETVQHIDVRFLLRSLVLTLLTPSLLGPRHVR